MASPRGLKEILPFATGATSRVTSLHPGLGEQLCAPCRTQGHAFGACTLPRGNV